GIEEPSFGAQPARGRFGAVQRSLAIPSVEAGHVAARERQPYDTVSVYIHPARRESRVGCLGVAPRNLVELGQPTFRVETHEPTGEGRVKGDPDHPVRRHTNTVWVY